MSLGNYRCSHAEGRVLLAEGPEKNPEGRVKGGEGSLLNDEGSIKHPWEWCKVPRDRRYYRRIIAIDTSWREIISSEIRIPSSFVLQRSYQVSLILALGMAEMCINEEETFEKW